jgi:hypothetical protein
MDLYSQHRWVTQIDPLYLSQELVLFGYFAPDDPPLLVDCGEAQDLIRQAEK